MRRGEGCGGGASFFRGGVCFVLEGLGFLGRKKGRRFVLFLGEGGKSENGNLSIHSFFLFFLVVGFWGPLFFRLSEGGVGSEMSGEGPGAGS